MKPYNNYSKFSKNEKDIDEKVEEIKKELKEKVEDVEEKVEEVKEKVVEAVIEAKKGVVANCENLNVRSEPKADADVVAIVSCDSEVSVDMKDSTSDFYAVCTAAGIEGYCMKQFINIQ